MPYTYHRVSEFLKYQLTAQSKYYLHSPLVYQFYLQVLEGEVSDSILAINDLKKELSQNYSKILIQDLGAHASNRERKVSDLAVQASMPYKYGKILYRLAKMTKPQAILELGTCLGIGTAYLTLGSPAAQVTTIEGVSAIREIAIANFEKLKLSNITTLGGNFDTVLPSLSNLIDFQLIFLDGNHRYQPTMDYFNFLMKTAQEGTIFIIDDIYWSLEMTLAWGEIKADSRISLTIDIYRMGFAFVSNKKLAKEDFVLRF